MIRKLLVTASLLLATPAFAQNVQQGGTVSAGHIPYWVSSGVIGDGGTGADSPITTIGVTAASGQGICTNSDRTTAAGWIGMCLGFIGGIPSINVQNYGSATAQPLQFVVNGVTYPFPGILNSMTVGTTIVQSGTPNGLFYDNAGVLGNLATLNNGVLITSGVGLPSIATTLPSALTIPGPTFSGTVLGSFTASGNLILSGNNTFTGQGIFQGVTAPASAAGNTVVMGTIAAPTLTNNGQAFTFNTTVNGAVLQGAGSTYDTVLLNKSGSVAIGIGTGTTVPVLPGLASGSCSSALSLDASNNIVKTTCPGTATSITVGTTTVVSGTNGNIEFNNAGTLGEVTPGNGVGIVSTTLGLTAARRTLPTKQVFTTGSGTYTTPANTLWLEITLVGGGSGGAGGNNAAATTAGGNTCWNTTGAACTTPLYSATGATATTGSTPGGGGGSAGSATCDWTAVGGSGSSGVNSISGSLSGVGGLGGNSSLGGGGAAIVANTGVAGAVNTGSGGGGGATTASGTLTAGAGGSAGGTCHVIINTPAATYTYAVGAGGAGTAGGANGNAGAAGATGQIIVYEHYGT